MAEPVVVSTFFSKHDDEDEELHEDENQNLCDGFLHSIDELNTRLECFKVPPPVNCIYNSTIYARQTFEMYVRKYCNTKKPIMYFGMNPGPWGMSQTGVPFGEIKSVRDWLKINGPVNKPPRELKERPVLGFQCTRTEISGKRFWGLMKNVCGTPDNFFRTSFVYNYLPQQWMKVNGCNVTPNDFRAADMKELYDICDPTFIKVLEMYEVETIVAVGKFCETRAKKALQKYLPHKEIKVLYLPHPSPRTVNNNDWDQKSLQILKTLNLLRYYTHDLDQLAPLDTT